MGCWKELDTKGLEKEAKLEICQNPVLCSLDELVTLKLGSLGSEDNIVALDSFHDTWL